MVGFVVQMLDVETQKVMLATDWTFEKKEAAEKFAEECNALYAKRGKIQSPTGRYYVPSEDVVFVVAEAEEAAHFSGANGRSYCGLFRKI